MLSPTSDRVQECHSKLRALLTTTEERWLVRDLVNVMVAEMLDRVDRYLGPELIYRGIQPAEVDEVLRQVSVRISNAWSFQIREFLNNSK